MNEDELICENCEEKFESLVTRQGFCMTYFVEWVCESCFEKLEGKTWQEYKRERDGGE